MRLRDKYTDAVAREISARVPHGTRADTVFLGGGTPSVLMPGQLKRLLSAVRERFELSKDAEITCEANPGAASRAFLDMAAECGVNRLSLGLQAASPRLLRMLGRAHTAEAAHKTIMAAREAGIHNINLDLMFGLPGQTAEDWAETLAFALASGAGHISCYGLIVEEGTPLKNKIDAGELCLPEPEEEREMYETARETLFSNGFEQYEISNFALPGLACRHNLGCWLRENYFGFGCAAHGLENGDTRRQNPSTVEDYLSGEEADIQVIPPNEQMFETMMLGLRMTEGVSEQRFFDIYGVPLQAVYGARLERSMARGLTERKSGAVRLTRRGMDLMNAVLLDLMDEDAIK